MASLSAEQSRVSWLAESGVSPPAQSGGSPLSAEMVEHFVTAVLPGMAQGHELLTARAGAAVPGVDLAALRRGVVRVDAGKHVWNLPGALAGSLDPTQQRRHALRATVCQSIPAAVGDMRGMLILLHRRARTTSNPARAFEWAGEVLHLIQDSYSRAHVERANITNPAAPHPIRYVRYFGFISKLPPRRSTAPLEHNFPKDDRDTVHSSPGVLKPEALIAVAASVEYLRMLVAQRGRAASPRDAVELRTFLNRHFSVGGVISPGRYHPQCGTSPTPRPGPGPGSGPLPIPFPVPFPPRRSPTPGSGPFPLPFPFPLPIPSRPVPSPGSGPSPRPFPFPLPFPSGPRPTPLPRRPRRVGVLDRFAFDKADVLFFHRLTLSRLALAIVARHRAGRPVRTVLLVGHTDSAGRAAYNVGLGIRRARAVGVALRAAVARLNPGVARSLHIVTRSGGESRPAVPNTTPANRARNRRVEVFFSSLRLVR